MIVNYVIYADPSDYGFTCGPSPVWGNVREHLVGGSSASPTNTDIEAGETLSGGNYRAYQGFLGFDTSILPFTAVTAASLTFPNNVSDGTTVIEIWESEWTASGSASYVPGSQLGALVAFGSFTPAASGSATCTSSSTSIPISSLYKLLVAGQKTRTNVAPVGFQSFDFTAADTGGTTLDPALNLSQSIGTAIVAKMANFPKYLLKRRPS